MPVRNYVINRFLDEGSAMALTGATSGRVVTSTIARWIVARYNLAERTTSIVKENHHHTWIEMPRRCQSSSDFCTVSFLLYCTCECHALRSLRPSGARGNGSRFMSWCCARRFGMPAQPAFRWRENAVMESTMGVNVLPVSDCGLVIAMQCEWW
ncbi:hypothetical protein OK016_08070 [Vibrio chagasii]|nr:hypothetical protein [Vibrio chagasii]